MVIDNLVLDSDQSAKMKSRNFVWHVVKQPGNYLLLTFCQLMTSERLLLDDMCPEHFAMLNGTLLSCGPRTYLSLG